MKRIFILAIALGLGLTACGGKDQSLKEPCTVHTQGGAQQLICETGTIDISTGEHEHEPPRLIKKTTTCIGLVGGKLLYTYRLVDMQSGEVYVYASLSGGDIQSSGSTWYLPDQNGAEVGGILLIHDVYERDSGGFWVFEFDRQAAHATVTYSDPELSQDITEQLKQTDCNSHIASDS